jgi:hypothetical protein
VRQLFKIAMLLLSPLTPRTSLAVAAGEPYSPLSKSSVNSPAENATIASVDA